MTRRLVLVLLALPLLALACTDGVDCACDAQSGLGCVCDAGYSQATG